MTPGRNTATATRVPSRMPLFFRIWDDSNCSKQKKKHSRAIEEESSQSVSLFYPFDQPLAPLDPMEREWHADMDIPHHNPLRVSAQRLPPVVGPPPVEVGDNDDGDNSIYDASTIDEEYDFQNDYDADTDDGSDGLQSHRRDCQCALFFILQNGQENDFDLILNGFPLPPSIFFGQWFLCFFLGYSSLTRSLCDWPSVVVLFDVL